MGALQAERKGVVKRNGSAKVVPLFYRNPEAYGMKKADLPDTGTWKRLPGARGLGGLIKPTSKTVLPAGYKPELVKGLELIPGLSFSPNDISDQQMPAAKWWPLDMVMIDHNFQRELTASDLGLMCDIISGWRWAKMQALNGFVLPDGRLYLTDGQKTALAAKHRGDIPKLPGLGIHVESISEGLAQMASAFIALNTANTPVSKVDIFTASILEGDPVSVATREILLKHDIKIINVARHADISFGTRETMIASTFKDVVKYRGAEFLDEILSIAANCNFRPIRRDHILAIQHIFKIEKTKKVQYDRARLIEAINRVICKYDLLEAKENAARNKEARSLALANLYIKRYGKA